MSFEIYELRDVNGKKFNWERYAIMNNYDGRFLEWGDLEDLDYGDQEINEQLDCDSSIVVSKSQADLIVRKLEWLFKEQNGDNPVVKTNKRRT